MRFEKFTSAWSIVVLNYIRSVVGSEERGGVAEPCASLEGEDIVALPDELFRPLRVLDAVEQILETVGVIGGDSIGSGEAAE